MHSSRKKRKPENPSAGGANPENGFQRWTPQNFESTLRAPGASAPPVPPPLQATEPPPSPPAPDPPEEATVCIEAPEPAQNVTVLPELPDDLLHFPTAEEIERMHEDAQQEGYQAGYEEGLAQARSEAGQLHAVLDHLNQALTRLDQDVAEELLTLSLEVARQMVRQTLALRPELINDLVREALQQMPQIHTQIHLHPDDAQLVRTHLGDQLSHAGHRVVEDPAMTRGSARLEANGAQVDATLATRWRRIMENLGRDIPWDGENA